MLENAIFCAQDNWDFVPSTLYVEQKYLLGNLLAVARNESYLSSARIRIVHVTCFREVNLGIYSTDDHV